MIQKVIEGFEKLKWSYVIFIIAAGAGLFYYMLDTTELDSRTQSLQVSTEEKASIHKKIQEAKDFERQFEDKKKHYAELVKELQKLQGALPRQLFLPELFSELLREAKQLEIEIVSISADPKEEQRELYNSLGFALEARGSFLQFFIFLDRLAHLKRLINVQSVTLAKDAERPLITLGGEEGVFSQSGMSGGRAAYPGIRASLKLITYRYRGTAGGGG